jgi:hypothetical protein
MPFVGEGRAANDWMANHSSGSTFAEMSFKVGWCLLTCHLSSLWIRWVLGLAITTVKWWAWIFFEEKPQVFLEGRDGGLIVMVCMGQGHWLFFFFFSAPLNALGSFW